MRVLYAKQLTQSDAACSKQIKLPKNEAKPFVGELKHRQSATLVVKDVHGNPWSFLCTCYGCQYALSRVGNFAKEFNLKAGDVLVFLEDDQKQLVVSVNEHAPLHLKPTTKAARAGHRRKPLRPAGPSTHLLHPGSRPLSLPVPGIALPPTPQFHLPGGWHHNTSATSFQHPSPPHGRTATPPPGHPLANLSEPCLPFHVAVSHKRGCTAADVHPPPLVGSKQDPGQPSQPKRPTLRHDVHVKAEPAANWGDEAHDSVQCFPHYPLPTTSTPLLKPFYEHLQPPRCLPSAAPLHGGLPSPASSAAKGDHADSSDSRDTCPPQLRLLAKELTKMDVACAHDQVGIVLLREDVLSSGILGMLLPGSAASHHHQQRQQGEGQAEESFYSLELHVADPGGARTENNHPVEAHNWMACALTQSSNRKFWYLTGLGSFLKRHGARPGQVLELCCGMHHGTFSASLR